MLTTVLAGMSEVECDHQVALSDYIDVDKYYLYTGQKGRITSQYIEDSDGNIVDNPNPGTNTSLFSEYKLWKWIYPHFIHNR